MLVRGVHEHHVRPLPFGLLQQHDDTQVAVKNYYLCDLV